jgi:hypothetical protein
MIMLTCQTEQEGFKQFFNLLDEFRRQDLDLIDEIPTQDNELAFQRR